MTYHNLIKYLEQRIKDIERNHKDRFLGDSHYSDYNVERDVELIIEMECAMNVLKDQMCN